MIVCAYDEIIDGTVILAENLTNEQATEFVKHPCVFQEAKKENNWSEIVYFPEDMWIDDDPYVMTEDDIPF